MVACPAILADMAFWPVASTVFFFTLFVGIIVWLIVTGRSGRWSRDARMPLDDVHPVEPRTPPGERGGSHHG